MSKHTSGPWLVAPDGNVVSGQAGIVERIAVSIFCSKERRDANARLIAAAPEMLEALREFMGDFVSIVTAANHNDLATIIYVAKACQKEISELLKKVEGEV
jgi:hypothetical protein